MIKIGTEINKIEPRKTIEKFNETKSCFFEKVNKIDKPLVRLTKNRREDTQIAKIRNGSGATTTNFTEIKKILRECYEHLYTNKLGNLDEMDKFQETQSTNNDS